ncbi:MAG: DUF6582 domain-containing protein [Vulcanimicrobiaceae bacterium]
MGITWKPVSDPQLPRSQLPASAFAFPAERKEPLTDANHVRSAIARFGRVDGVDDDECAQAYANIAAAARHYGIALHAHDWHDLGRKL